MRSALPGSLALHAAMALLMTWMAHRLPSGVPPAEEAVSVVFEPAAPAEAAQQPMAPPSLPEPPGIVSTLAVSAPVVPPPSDVPPAPTIEPPSAPQPDVVPTSPAQPAPNVLPKPKVEPKRPIKPVAR